MTSSYINDRRNKSFNMKFNEKQYKNETNEDYIRSWNGNNRDNEMRFLNNRNRNERNTENIRKSRPPYVNDDGKLYYSRSRYENYDVHNNIPKDPNENKNNKLSNHDISCQRRDYCPSNTEVKNMNRKIRFMSIEFVNDYSTLHSVQERFNRKRINENNQDRSCGSPVRNIRKNDNADTRICTQSQRRIGNKSEKNNEQPRHVKKETLNEKRFREYSQDTIIDEQRRTKKRRTDQSIDVTMKTNCDFSEKDNIPMLKNKKIRSSILYDLAEDDLVCRSIMTDDDLFSAIFEVELDDWF
jgi:hypothetical protein